MYKIKWTQLADIINLRNLRILDFGSGFGLTANYLAKDHLYEPDDLIKWGGNLKIEKILSVRTFYGLQREDVKHEPGWMDKMFNIEMKVADMEPFKSISLFHHVLLRKL